MGELMGDLFKDTPKKKKGEEDIAELIKKELGVRKPAREEQENESEQEIPKVSNSVPKHLEDFESMVAATPDYDDNSFDTAEKTVIAKYNEVTIYKIKGQPLLHYHIPAPKSTISEQEIVDTIKEAATRLISIAPYKIRDEKQRRNVYFQKIMEIITSSPELRIPEGMANFYADSVVREMVGYGKIDLLLKDDLLEEIMIIGPLKPVFVFHRQYEMMTTNIAFTGDKGIQDIIGRIARYAGRRVDYSQPLLDARLPDGSRVNATLPPASVSGSTLTIRKFRDDPYTIIDLINYKTFDSDVGAFLWTCVDGLNTKPANIIISGGTGSGKTTLLNVLCSLIPSNERVISIEDTAELSLPLKHWIRLEARPPGIEGTGEITLEMLTKNALRMRPDRIIVGEVRSSEAEALFTAINTGHQGSMGTLHANSAEETLVRITSPPMSVPQMMLAGLDMIIIENRLHDRKRGTIRRLVEISEVMGVIEGTPKIQRIFEWDPKKDKMYDTSMPSRVLKNISLYSGKSTQQIKDEIDYRTQFLDLLLEKNVHKKDDVAKYIAKYYESQSTE